MDDHWDWKAILSPVERHTAGRMQSTAIEPWGCGASWNDKGYEEIPHSPSLHQIAF